MMNETNKGNEMQVYSVIVNDGDCYSLCGVFATRADAVAFVNTQEGYQNDWYEYSVIESALGEEIDTTTVGEVI
jgi:hypothetical protein